MLKTAHFHSRNSTLDHKPKNLNERKTAEYHDSKPKTSVLTVQLTVNPVLLTLFAWTWLKPLFFFFFFFSFCSAWSILDLVLLLHWTFLAYEHTSPNPWTCSLILCFVILHLFETVHLSQDADADSKHARHFGELLLRSLRVRLIFSLVSDFSSPGLVWMAPFVSLYSLLNSLQASSWTNVLFFY